MKPPLAKLRKSGIIVADYIELHYRALERFKTQSLKMHRGKFDRKVSLNLEAAINKMGRIRSLPMDRIVHIIWEWAIGRNNWVTVTFQVF